MNCREFEIEWIALDDLARLPAAMEQHRLGCRHCTALSDDLKALASEAQTMRAASEPPQRVWATLRNQMEIEGLIRGPANQKAPQQTQPRRAETPAGWWPSWLPTGLAYTAVFFVALGVVYKYNEATNPGSQPPPVAGAPQVPALALTRPNTAEGEQDKNVEELIAGMPEERREIFVSNWNQVNASIQNLQGLVEANPGDPFVNEMLKRSLQQREHLSGTMIGWEER